MKRELSTSKIGLGFGALLAAMLVLLAAVKPGLLLGQAATASIHGHVNNAAGQPVTTGEVRLTTERDTAPKDRKFKYVFPIDPNGDYKGTGIAPGDYVVVVYQLDKSIDFVDSAVFKPGDDKAVNFDMSRAAYIEKMTPEEKKALEEYKKKNAAVVEGNKTIQNLNALLTQARADNKAGNYDSAITAMQTAVQQKPDEAILYVTLGDAQLGSASAAQKAAKTAGTSPTDAAIMAKYNDAAASFKKAVEVNAAAKKPSPETAAAAYNQLGQSYGRAGNAKDASEAYDNAAKAQPTQAGMYYFNEAATLYNGGKPDEAAVAADKAITADPARADAYYIKGQALISKASVDPKTQKVTVPAGCVDAYQKYLELAPDGPHAEDVKQILTGIGEKVKSTYKAPKKS